MTRKNIELAELKMSAAQFDQEMRKALGAAPAAEFKKKRKKKKA